MQQGSAPDPLLKSIASAVRLYQGPPDQGITVAELLNKVFSDLACYERYELVDEVARLVPESARGELRRLVEAILQPGAAYVPFTFGIPPDPEARRRRMVPACRRLAELFRQHLDMAQGAAGSAGRSFGTGQ